MRDNKENKKADISTFSTEEDMLIAQKKLQKQEMKDQLDPKVVA